MNKTTLARPILCYRPSSSRTGAVAETRKIVFPNIQHFRRSQGPNRCGCPIIIIKIINMEDHGNLPSFAKRIQRLQHNEAVAAQAAGIMTVDALLELAPGRSHRFQRADNPGLFAVLKVDQHIVRGMHLQVGNRSSRIRPLHEFAIFSTCTRPCIRWFVLRPFFAL